MQGFGFGPSNKETEYKKNQHFIAYSNIQRLESHCQIHLDYSDCNILQVMWQGLSNPQRGFSI